MNTNALDVHSFAGDIGFFSKQATQKETVARKVLVDRILIVISISIISLLLFTVLNPHHFFLTACFAWAGMWASDKLTRHTNIYLAPFLIFLNLVSWPESFVALPIAALTIGLASELAIDECSRDALRLSGLTCAALTLLCELA